MISYRCPDCGGDDEAFHHSRSNAPGSVPCRGVRVSATQKVQVEKRVEGADGTITIELEEVELAPVLEVCGGTAIQRDSIPGEQFSRPARGFEKLSIFERVNYDSLPDDQKRSLNKFYIPGHNSEPTEPGMRRIDITDMATYNREIKRINEYETQKMRDHRDMHREYFKARRGAMREDINARQGHNIRQSPLLKFLTDKMRSRSDGKFNARYGKPLDAKFHSQLIEFDQGKIQDYCSEDTKWHATRAK